MAATPRKRTVSRSQQARVLVQLREMILRGTFKGGARLAELSLAAELEVSRTPVKLALTKLEEEGLVEALPSGGYAACHLTSQALLDGVVLRGALEALAARLLAEQGLANPVEKGFKELLAQGDELLIRYARDEHGIAYDGYVAYEEMNNGFHNLLMEACGNKALLRAWELNNRRPSASPSATLSLHESRMDATRLLRSTHLQHHLLVQAIIKREGMRAHSLAEEHATAASVSIGRHFALSRVPVESGMDLEQHLKAAGRGSDEKS